MPPCVPSIGRLLCDHCSLPQLHPDEVYNKELWMLKRLGLCGPDTLPSSVEQTVASE